jgi:P27 family predicted phage terminase small subunit
VPLLDTMGLATRIDRAALVAYCVVYERWRLAEGQLRLYGVVIKSPSGYPILSPYLSVANRALAQMKGLLEQFGMTPSARTRLQVPERPDPDDELAAWRQAHPRQR